MRATWLPKRKGSRNHPHIFLLCELTERLIPESFSLLKGSQLHFCLSNFLILLLQEAFALLEVFEMEWNRLLFLHFQNQNPERRVVSQTGASVSGIPLFTPKSKLETQLSAAAFDSEGTG